MTNRWGKSGNSDEFNFLGLHLFILFGAISPLFSSSILGTYRPGEFIFQGPLFLPFHTVHGVLKARILKWFAIPFSSGPRFFRILYQDLRYANDTTVMAESEEELKSLLMSVKEELKSWPETQHSKN